jgi:uncharacterized protein
MQNGLQWTPQDYDYDASLKFRRPIYTFIVKVASRCNLDCGYCYVYQSPDQSWKSKPQFLSSAVLEQVARRIQEHVVTHDLNEVSVVFHGGEPLLAGVDRLKDYVTVLSSTITCPVKFGMQTNGILLDKELIAFLSENQIRIGISLDGVRTNNDRFRVYHDGRSSYDETVSAIRLVQSYPEHKQILGGILVVVDIRNKPIEILRALDDLGVRGANLLLPDSNYVTLPFRPGGDTTAYGKWLHEFFVLWLESYSHIEVPYFEEILNLMLGGVSTSEEIGAQSVDFVIVETNGDIEAVDTLKMVGREATFLNLNVARNSFDEAITHPAIYSRMSGFNSLCDTCKECEHLNHCGGGYLPHRYSAPNGFVNPSVYCEDLKYLFAQMRSHVFKTR